MYYKFSEYTISDITYNGSGFPLNYMGKAMSWTRGAGSVVGGIVSGSVNSFGSAAMHFGISGVLNMGGKFIGNKIGNVINRAIQNRAAQKLATPIYSMLGDAIWDAFGGVNFVSPIVINVANSAQRHIGHQMGSFVNSISYMIMLELINAISTGWYN